MWGLMDFSFYRDMPKADLHLHLDGAVRPSTMIELAASTGAGLPTTDPVALSELVTAQPGCSTLSDFLGTFDVFYPLLRTPEALERIAMEAVEDSATDGIVHLEARFAPVLQSRRDFPIESAVKAALKGFSSGLAKTGITGGVILCCYRSESPESSLETVEAAVRFHGEGVVGIDLAGDELNHSAMPHLGAFIRARDAGIPVTVHAGEAGPCANIREAVLLLGARRLGHAVKLVQDEDLLAHVAAEGITLETCLTSNLLTGAVNSLSEHPLRSFLDAGVAVALCTDDPSVCRTTLSREFTMAVDAFGLSRGEVAILAQNSILGSFSGEGRDVNEEKIRSWFNDER
ncbi:MAG: adenosine deaminase [Planctomycetota bacterium]|jgi:adenosine deaminase